MMYDLIEATPKVNKTKVFIASIIVIIIVLIIVGAVIIHYNKKNNNIAKIKEENNIIENIENIENINKTANPQNKKMHQISVNMIPIYNETTNEKMKKIYSNNEEKTVYLTFDDGPSKTVTPLILDLLKQENIKATFFVLGSRAELNPELIKREYNEGHYIANHGYSHVYSRIYESKESVFEEYIKTRDIVGNILQNGYDGHLFRFPGGSTGGKYKNLKADAKNFLIENGVSSIDWNALSQDAAGAKTKEALIQNVIESVGSKNTAVILMHDAGDKILTYESLIDVINYLREQGYVFKNFYNIMK